MCCIEAIFADAKSIAGVAVNVTVGVQVSVAVGAGVTVLVGEGIGVSEGRGASVNVSCTVGTSVATTIAVGVEQAATIITAAKMNPLQKNFFIHTSCLKDFGQGM